MVPSEPHLRCSLSVARPDILATYDRRIDVEVLRRDIGNSSGSRRVAGQ